MITALSKWLVFFIFVFVGPVSGDEVLERANASIEYLQANTTHPLKHDNVDIERSEQAIADLNDVIADYELSQADQNLIRMVRGFSLKTINLKRLNSGKKVDIAQAEQAIDDFVYLSAQLGTVDLFYAAGHVAMHLLSSPSMAYDYWLKCAEGGHGGCMNIVATHRFTGENGLPIDIDKAVYWHKRVYDSGINYVCAGAFSANMLRDIAFFYLTSTQVTRGSGGKNSGINSFSRLPKKLSKKMCVKWACCLLAIT